MRGVFPWNVGPNPETASRLNEAHEKIEEGLSWAVWAGDLLIQVKAELPHGKFLPWVEANCRFDRRSATNYMKAARATDPNGKAFPISQPLDSIAGKFSVIYADPPWRYEHVKTESRAIENQYPTMALEEIKALPVGDLAEKGGVLFLWATAPKLAECLEVIEAWGFVYRTCAVWDKEIIGMGYWFRQRHELLLVATRGETHAPEPAERRSSVYREKRGAHSAKPEYFRTMIERQFPEPHRLIELFTRERRPRWVAWGNEA